MRLKITLALIIAAFFSGWKVHVWYEGNKEKEVIIKEVKVFNAQVLKDQDDLLSAEIELDKFKDDADKLKVKAHEINKGICNTVDSHRVFNILYNETISKANSSTTSKVPD